VKVIKENPIKTSVNNSDASRIREGNVSGGKCSSMGNRRSLELMLDCRKYEVEAKQEKMSSIKNYKNNYQSNRGIMTCASLIRGKGRKNEIMCLDVLRFQQK
jgi:hypothetical protein